MAELVSISNMVVIEASKVKLTVGSFSLHRGNMLP